MAVQWKKYYPNPDENFVMRGGQPFYYREAPGFTSNSMLTDTTKNLSQHIYNSDKYGDDIQLRGSLRTISRSLNRVSGDLRKSLLMENDSNLRTSKMSHHYTHAELNEALRDAMNKNPPPPEFLSHTDWYTKPIHISSSVNIPMSHDDMLAARYFPITLGESKSLEMVGELKPGRGRSQSQSKDKGRRQRSKSATSRTGQTREEVRRLDNTYFLTAMAPHIKTAGIAFTTPYSDEISKLRMEKLGLEEQQYLELKRQAELERIRGPKPKWYEMKTPEFHYEASKNNELLRNSDKWDDLLRYRESLVHATNQLRTALKNYEIPSY